MNPHTTTQQPKNWDWCLDPELRDQLKQAWEEYEKRGDEFLLYAYFQLVESVPDEALRDDGYYGFSE